MENVWSRQARRKRQMEQKDVGTSPKRGLQLDERKATLGVRIQLKRDGTEGEGFVVLIRWLKGRDAVLFESFCGMLKRKVEVE
jgi:23S rRNA (adenine1618-N6)-methyltransferase